MKRLLCILLAALILVSLCACAGKKDKDGKGDKGDKAEETKTVEETGGGKVEEIVTAPEKDDDKNDGPAEIGTLPIIFGDEDEQKNESEQKNDGGGKDSSSGTDVPSTTTKKPPTTSSSSETDNKSNVVETPIIPFN